MEQLNEELIKTNEFFLWLEMKIYIFAASRWFKQIKQASNFI